MININPTSITGGPNNNGYWLFDISRYKAQPGYIYLFLNISQTGSKPIIWCGRLVISPSGSTALYPDNVNNATVNY